jgi:hypothetical protein
MTTPAPHILHLNGLSVTNNVLSGLAAPLANGDATNKLYVDAQITGLVNGAPGVLDTFKEFADAINNDSSYATTITTALATKATIVSLTTETDRAIAAETANALSISNEATTARAAEGVLRNDLAAESTTARAAELVLRTDLATEATTARAAELVLRTDLATEVSAARAAELVLRNDLSAEVSAARAAELVLRTDLATEVSAARAAELVLRDALTELDGRTPTATGFGKVATYINALHAYFFQNSTVPGQEKPKPDLPANFA